MDSSTAEREVHRIESLLRLCGVGGTALDVGARSGAISEHLISRFERVVALDLVRPTVKHPKITCVEGDATDLPFPDHSFDAVLCSEMLEHLSPSDLSLAGRELARVTRSRLIVGVPYKQDIRLGRTTCAECGTINPPWGHVNVFDESALLALFPSLQRDVVELVGTSPGRTNWLSASLLDFAGNPYGTYGQQERCISCGGAVRDPQPRNVPQKLATKTAVLLQRVQAYVSSAMPNWIHMRFEKTATSPSIDRSPRPLVVQNSV